MLNHTSNAGVFSASVHHIILQYDPTFRLNWRGCDSRQKPCSLCTCRLLFALHAGDRTTNSWILVFWQTLVNVDECGDGWYAWGPRMVTVSIGPHRSLHTAHGVCLILSSVLLVVASSRKLWEEFWCVRESTSFTEQSIV
jgi:hypothetical protein